MTSGPAFGRSSIQSASDSFDAKQPAPAGGAINKKILGCCAGAPLMAVGGALCLIPVVGPFIGGPIAAIGAALFFLSPV